ARRLRGTRKDSGRPTTSTGSRPSGPATERADSWPDHPAPRRESEEEPPTPGGSVFADRPFVRAESALVPTTPGAAHHRVSGWLCRCAAPTRWRVSIRPGLFPTPEAGWVPVRPDATERSNGGRDPGRSDVLGPCRVVERRPRVPLRALPDDRGFLLDPNAAFLRRAGEPPHAPRATRPLARPRSDRVYSRWHRFEASARAKGRFERLAGRGASNSPAERANGGRRDLPARCRISATKFRPFAGFSPWKSARLRLAARARLASPRRLRQR